MLTNTSVLPQIDAAGCSSVHARLVPRGWLLLCKFVEEPFGIRVCYATAFMRTGAYVSVEVEVCRHLDEDESECSEGNGVDEDCAGWRGAGRGRVVVMYAWAPPVEVHPGGCGPGM